MKEISVRYATENDADSILNIYSYYVKNTAITFEWIVPSVETYAAKIRTISSKYPFLVAIIDDKIVGYTYASRFRVREAYDWCVEMSVYVDKDYQHIGVGKVLYNAIERLLKKQNVVNLYACISNMKGKECHSIVFHEAMGYKLIGTFENCGVKFNNWLDIVWMQKVINEPIVNQPSFLPICEIKE